MMERLLPYLVLAEGTIGRGGELELPVVAKRESTA